MYARVITAVDVLIQPGNDDAANTRIELAELFIGPVGIEQSPHLEELCRDVVSAQRLGVGIEFTLRLFPGDEIQFIFDA